jgi:hypothetical protein
MCQDRRWLVLLLAAVIPATVRATMSDLADHSIRQFLAQSNEQQSYHGTRRLTAENRSRTGWVEATAEYSPRSGFRYEITAEGGSSRQD